MKNIQQKSSKAQNQPDQSQSRNYQTLSLLEELFAIRLVEKLSRPMQFQKKQEVYKEFKRKFLALHQLLQKTKKQFPKQTESTKSRHSVKAIKQRTQKQDIRRIQSKYQELLIEGSFKFYPKVAKLYNLPLTLEPINIEEWANQCLDQDPEPKGCC